MFSNSQLEIIAKDELLNINDQQEDLYYMENNTNHHEPFKNYQQFNQEKQIQSYLKILNSTFNFCQGKNLDPDKKNRKEIPHQSINEYQNLKRSPNSSNSKTVDNQRRKVLKKEVISTVIRSNENSLQKSTTRGSTKPDIKIYESLINYQEEFNPYSDILTASNNNTYNQFTNSQQNSDSNQNKDNDEDETPIFLSQIYQKREKLVNESKDYSKNRIKGQRMPHLSELQQNNQNISQDKQTETNIQPYKQIQMIADKKCFSVKNSKRQLNVEPLSSKKIEDAKIRRASLHNIKKFNLDNSSVSQQAQDQQKQSQNLYQNLIQQPDNQDKQQINLQIKGQAASKENILRDQKRVSNKDPLRRIDSFQKSRERWIDKLESDYFNLLSKNIKGQRGYQHELQQDNHQLNETCLQNPPQALRESFLDQQNESQIISAQENSKSPDKIQITSIMNISQTTKMKSADPSKYLINRPQAQQNFERKNSTPQKITKKTTQSGRRRKSIQIFKRFDPNVVSIDMIKSQLKEGEIPETVQKYFESKQQRILHQQQFILPQSQNASPRDINQSINTTKRQDKPQMIDISQGLFQNEEIINRINDLNKSLGEQNTKNVQQLSVQSQRNSPQKEQKFVYKNSHTPFNDQINSPIVHNQQGSLFYNYIEYKQFKSKLEYEKEMKKKEMQKKAKLRNKSPFHGVTYQLEEYQVASEKQKESFQNDANLQNNQNKKNQQQINQQNQQEICLQYHVNLQKQRQPNINNNFFHLNDGFVSQFRTPQSANNQNDQKKIKLIQFSADTKQHNQNPESIQNSLNNSLQQNINNNNSNNNNNKLPLILKKYIF
ncbi:hypothetical protein TTHERM_00497910 (macronuclear) [Tetrahymena thermophila SB210]|uniref:Uncharacterized protein n=1 Tax=Tetrahymena thermophila (strain SB210) TaxID=312017 RepID=I7MB65_TETTS|nr:hypothetical protein TTHERM_00497910 [Tetrahymena thermophila SB210]EAS07737.2 hypothetical protein TTHERM_00497910 [Tetrahymena thermophila SB210]|eukprot:XP_001027979.2 hypothetical protein TTHERM_00497910 [Tetrahymena thermophila SB210]